MISFQELRNERIGMQGPIRVSESVAHMNNKYRKVDETYNNTSRVDCRSGLILSKQPIYLII